LVEVRSTAIIMLTSPVYQLLLCKPCSLIYNYWLNKIGWSQLLEGLEVGGFGVTWLEEERPGRGGGEGEEGNQVKGRRKGKGREGGGGRRKGRGEGEEGKREGGEGGRRKGRGEGEGEGGEGGGRRKGREREEEGRRSL
jgi:hypothetical protein